MDSITTLKQGMVDEGVCDTLEELDVMLEDMGVDESDMLRLIRDDWDTGLGEIDCRDDPS